MRPYPNNPYSFSRNGNLFIMPIGPSINEVPYPTYSITKPRDYSLWVRGHIVDPAFHLDHARMPPSLFQEVRDDLVRYSPIEVTRSAFRRSEHAYVGVIDSKGQPYYFALDSRGISVREVAIDDDRVWKTFDRLSEQEHMMAVRLRRHDAAAEMVDVDRELSEPKLVVVQKGDYWNSAGKKVNRPDIKPQLSVPSSAHAVHPSTRVTVARAPHAIAPESVSPPVVGVANGPSAKLKKKPKEEKQARLKEPKAPREPKASRPPKQTRLKAGRRPKKQKEPRAPREPKPKRLKAGKRQTATSAWRAKHPGGHVDTMRVKLKSLSTKKRKGDMDWRVNAHRKEHHKDPLVVEKALPKKSKDAPVKKTPNKKASTKKVGAGGKPRYTYPNEKGGAKAKQVPLVVVQHDDSKHADPGELANQLNVSVRTLQHTARKLGREGFSKFMRSHLKRFVAKHRLDPDYWSTLYERLSLTDVKRDSVSL